MKKQQPIPSAAKNDLAPDQRTVWQRLAQSASLTEEKLRSWGSHEAWGVVEGNQQKWRFELRCPLLNGTFESPCNFRFLDLKKSAFQPGSNARNLVLHFDASDPECRRIWPHLVEELLEAISLSCENRPKGIIKALKGWKSFWPKEKKNELSAELRQGLFGELCLLNWLLDKEVRPETALGAWMGPNKRLHDFQFQGSHVEVKANASKRRVVTISDLRQLDESSAGRLFLAHMSLVKTEKKEHSLSALVEKIERKLTDSQKDLMTMKLKISRWFQLPQKLRDETIFYSKAPEFFTVIEGFPRLLGNDLRTGVSVTKYKISLPASHDPKFAADAAEVLASID